MHESLFVVRVWRRGDNKYHTHVGPDLLSGQQSVGSRLSMR